MAKWRAREMEELLLAKFGHCLAKSDPDVLVLRRQDGAFVAAFSARGATREGIAEAVKEHYGRLLEPNAALSGISCTVFGGNSARDALSETSQGFQPSSGKGPAYNASEKLQLTKTEDGARVTLNWVYAEENYVSIGYQVEDLKDDRRVAGHPAELQPLLGFGYGKPTPREKEYLKKSGLGTDIVALTDERDTKFRMVDNLG